MVLFVIPEYFWCFLYTLEVPSPPGVKIRGYKYRFGSRSNWNRQRVMYKWMLNQSLYGKWMKMACFTKIWLHIQFIANHWFTNGCWTNRYMKMDCFTIPRCAECMGIIYLHESKVKNGHQVPFRIPYHAWYSYHHLPQKINQSCRCIYQSRGSYEYSMQSS